MLVEPILRMVFFMKIWIIHKICIMTLVIRYTKIGIVSWGLQDEGIFNKPNTIVAQGVRDVL